MFSAYEPLETDAFSVPDLPPRTLKHTLSALIDYAPEDLAPMVSNHSGVVGYGGGYVLDSLLSIKPPGSAGLVAPSTEPFDMQLGTPWPHYLDDGPQRSKLFGLGALEPKERLAKLFGSLLAQINFGDVIVPMRKSKPVVDQEKYRLVPILRTAPAVHSFKSFDVVVPFGIRTTYKKAGGKPFLDTPHAIGLVYGDWLVAVGGARMEGSGRLLVRQLQDVTDAHKLTDPERFSQTGLRNGFWWCDSLVKAWEEVARRIGGVDEIGIQSNKNNSWPAVKSAGGRGYDDVAARMHYDSDETTGNWVRRLDTRQ